ncbi:bifunctional phosphoribosyl-AMP cyclohydrolase/phosphoribosyl-ATP diphosphatase HisIE [Chloroflexus sp. MS-CIW-1]|jgi:phosphoribosyl-ATP pyrophosphohydrolase/phosphoribosyl-AMP cyclohydrolase|uniref:bifunctional phosphoribosyl-AMP cyclohydrolase/phosphoribosyl-ATP diphosphatase HisIE n=1 Tax=Chloroflexus sp. MS-CIW-1 TaxID=3055768 RepID=UPI001AFD29EA|nr:bifunctional phosphoribosyl-AMP cyclohydrolase/phosphoribosyl-ATP diphosphatase HisIE [Chloroflexus sp. MS-CIW-1]MBO9347743.1 bifunctional phosphoribosyl-AMP cyclohydrolase/phosphoribosyl-ATP diphosphatase HisIE [Chloroflexus sp.]MDN5271545.1 bifunctional phosphoribosyl-AMP cyclohydrolase/phosphoribosyl-ATP diphosphatase HisIE [Chloroflexus sp. MS-CIW-1]
MVDIAEPSLLPVIVQHARSGEVLMLGYMNEEALTATRTSGFVTFYSRSRQRLWQKGETSGHTLRVVEILQDCDGDALLILAEPAGPTCHTGRPSCFFRDLSESEVNGPLPAVAILARLADRIHDRRDTDPATSYTARLLHGGIDRIGKKIGEEAAELIIAAKNGNPAEIAYELADLIYHSLVLLEQQGVTTEAVWAELTRRYQAS